MIAIEENEKIVKAVLITAIATALFVVLARGVWFFLSPKDDLLTKLVPFIQEFEGGLSRDPNDTASAYPAPWTYNGEAGWHTNKGVTYQSFVSNASKCGYPATAEVFFSMPDRIWLCILKNGYMSPFDLDRISHLERIQAVIITWAWGSGVGGATSRLSRFIRDEMNLSANSRDEIIETFRKKITRSNERMWFHRLCDRRAYDFSRMPTFPVHGKGWLRRLERFRQLFN